MSRSPPHKTALHSGRQVYSPSGKFSVSIRLTPRVIGRRLCHKERTTLDCSFGAVISSYNGLTTLMRTTQNQRQTELMYPKIAKNSRRSRDEDGERIAARGERQVSTQGSKGTDQHTQQRRNPSTQGSRKLALAQHLTCPQTPRRRCKRKVPTTHLHVRNKSSPHTVACAGTRANSAIQRPLISQHQISRYYQRNQLDNQPTSKPVSRAPRL